AGDDEGVAVEKTAAGFEDTKDFGEQDGAVGNVAEDIVGEDGVKAIGVVGELFGEVVAEETDLGEHVSSAGETVGVADGLGVEVEAGDAAAGAFGEIDGVAAGAAAELEDVGIER